MRTLARRARDTVLNPLPDLALRLSDPVMRQHMARLLREKPYDVVQVEGVEMAPYVPAAWSSEQPWQPIPPAPGLR